MSNTTCKRIIKLLALDLAGTTGYSVLVGNTIKTGTVSLVRGKLTGKRNPLPMVRLYKRLVLLTQYYRVERVVFEETFARGNAKYRLDSLQHAVILWAVNNGIPWQRVPPTQWKKAVLGRGHVSKAEYSRRALKRFKGERLWNSDQCAARLLLQFAMQQG